MQATYVEHMGNDLSVVNAARRSFNKRKAVLDERDIRLIAYLAKHNHIMPFAHPHITFDFKAPIFVARQLAKHQVGGVWSEMSRRYVDEEPEFWEPAHLRERAPDKKQGSGPPLNVWVETPLKGMIKDLHRKVGGVYKELLGVGVAPEQARAILPASTLTEWTWTGSLLFWSRVWNLRMQEDTQEETREVVGQIGPTMERLFPVSWPALVSGEMQDAKQDEKAS